MAHRSQPYVAADSPIRALTFRPTRQTEEGHPCLSPPRSRSPARASIRRTSIAKRNTVSGSCQRHAGSESGKTVEIVLDVVGSKMTPSQDDVGIRPLLSEQSVRCQFQSLKVASAYSPNPDHHLRWAYPYFRIYLVVNGSDIAPSSPMRRCRSAASNFIRSTKAIQRERDT